MRISFLFAAVVVSAVVFEKGLFGLPLELISMIGFLIAYILPVVFLESQVRNIARSEIPFGKGKIFIKLAVRSILTGLFSTVLFFFAMILCYGPSGEEGMFIFTLPLFFIGFFIVHIILSLIIFKMEKSSKKANIINVVILSLCGIAFVFGCISIIISGGKGYSSVGYVSDIISDTNDPSVCKKLPELPGLGLYTSIFIPSHFYTTYDEVNFCYYQMAKKTKNSGLCITPSIYYEQCISDLLVKKE